MTAHELLSAGDFGAAIATFRDDLTRDQNSLLSHQGLGLALAAVGQASDALSHTSLAAKRQPANPDFRYAHAFALAAAGRLDEAITEYDVALALAPTHLGARNGLLGALLQKGTHSDVTEAEPYLDRARKIDSRNPTTLGIYLDFLIRTDQKGKVKQLVPSISDAARSDPRFAELLTRIPDEFRPVQPVAPVSAPPPAVPVAKPVAMPTSAPAPYQAKYRHEAEKTEWQPIAYNIMCGLWILLALLSIAAALRQNAPGATPFVVIMSLLQIGVAIGLLMRTDWISVVGRMYCILTILGQIFPFWLSLTYRDWLSFGLSIVSIAFAGFLYYLIGYEND
jgi:tetratricopeptide (TPR) repeat protein